MPRKEKATVVAIQPAKVVSPAEKALREHMDKIRATLATTCSVRLKQAILQHPLLIKRRVDRTAICQMLTEVTTKAVRESIEDMGDAKAVGLYYRENHDEEMQWTIERISKQVIRAAQKEIKQ